ncbi:hypothetical protein SISSUDRAFT_1041568 [Sistotremastrum suecicum HHB10207 ss-3]|uniref:GIT Spa2 homology (SHD) domain-containing protein n=1 Tax=Sistotremastrum suecicum HHB10207 ss-3 TaxID=1314776 RepID=A0A166H351_9AGAM|nr:hypothetical protein SISSUDRAFT_1041568 [Sistotremastrum suecicum HHB10207 ss-3]
MKIALFGGLMRYRTFHRHKDQCHEQYTFVSHSEGFTDPIFVKFLNETRGFLTDVFFEEEVDTNPNSRDKIPKLMTWQMQELCTDLYDEMRRRTLEVEGYLPHRDDFYPERNAARKKLSKLRLSRFEDLCFDVFREVEFRYPELKGTKEGLVPGLRLSAFVDPPPPYSPRVDRNKDKESFWARFFCGLVQ